MEDSKNALFVEPNAYINHFKHKDEVKPIKKVVFSEPYDCMPTYHINNDFQKDCCDCGTSKKDKDCNNHNHHYDCNCNYENMHQNHDCECNQNHKYNYGANKNNFNFDIKNLMPILSGLNKGVNGFDFNTISSLFNTSGGFDFSKLLSNPDIIRMAMSLFSSKNKKTKPNEEIICSEYEIKRYTKVK